MSSASPTVSYRCPIDYGLYEFSGLIDSIGGIYDKLELVLEHFDPFSTYDSKRRWNRGRFPAYRLRVAKIRYALSVDLESARLDLWLRGTELLEDVLLLIDMVSSWPLQEKSHFLLADHLTKDESQELLAKANSEVLDKIYARNLEEKFNMNLERLLQYVKPELRELYSNQAVRI